MASQVKEVCFYIVLSSVSTMYNRSILMLSLYLCSVFQDSCVFSFKMWIVSPRSILSLLIVLTKHIYVLACGLFEGSYGVGESSRIAITGAKSDYPTRLEVIKRFFVDGSEGDATYTIYQTGTVYVLVLAIVSCV